MKRVLITVLFFIALTATKQTKAQQHLPADQKYEYFILIQATTSKADIGAIESSFRGKPGVAFFQLNKRNHKYYILRSSVPVTQAQCAAWINNSAYPILEFASDPRQKELLVKRLH
jgi:hypothetical protein